MRRDQLDAQRHALIYPGFVHLGCILILLQRA
jgi:hypothetical protein